MKIKEVYTVIYYLSVSAMIICAIGAFNQDVKIGYLFAILLVQILFLILMHRSNTELKQKQP